MAASMRASSRPVSRPAAKARFGLDRRQRMPMAAMRSSCTAMSLSSPSPSCRRSRAQSAACAFCVPAFRRADQRKTQWRSAASWPGCAACGGCTLKLGERPALLAHLAPAAGQLATGENSNRKLPTVANEVVARRGPVARFEPCRGLERERPKARGRHCILRARQRSLAFLRKGVRD